MKNIWILPIFLLALSCEDKKSINSISKVFVEKDVALESLAENLSNPWGMTFLSDGSLLITERSGDVLRYKNGKMYIVNGVPEVISRGQGGLLDIVAHPNYKENNLIFFTASVGTKASLSTALFRAKFNNDQFQDVIKIFQAEDRNYSSDKHFGSRIAIDNKGFVFVGLGDRYNDRDYAQDLSYHNGKLIRIKDNGDIPEDNPFVITPNAKPEIWSYGHRNIQGLAIHPTTGALWSHEHGPKGGDEINVIKKGANYGWPLATFGVDYDGSIISNNTTIDGSEDPIHHWTPSIAPCGMNFYLSEVIPQWNGSLFLGALAGKHLNRITLENNKVVNEERLFEQMGRFRQVIQGPDGYIYFVTENPGVLYRILPSN